MRKRKDKKKSKLYRRRRFKRGKGKNGLKTMLCEKERNAEGEKKEKQ